MNAPTTTLPLPENWFWGFVTLAAIVIASFVVVKISPKDAPKETPLDRAKDALGLAGVNSGLFLIATLIWGAVFALLVAGLLTIIWQVILTVFPDTSIALSNWRFLLAQLAGMTGVLGAVVTLPVTLKRLHLQRETDRTTKESLFNEKINAATQDLYARRQAWSDEHNTILWHDDITRRNAAIDRLEGLVKERPSEAERVSRLLSVYVRELSAPSEFPAEIGSKDISFRDLSDWAKSLLTRSDMQNAVQTLGRLNGIHSVDAQSIKIDLRGSNLQAMDFEKGDYQQGLFVNARMQGAILTETNLQSAILTGVHLHGTSLTGANLQKAILKSAVLPGSILDEVNLSDANLSDAVLKFTEIVDGNLQDADLKFAQLQGAALVGTNLRKAKLIGTKLQEANLSVADLRGADLFEAQLQGAELFQSKLQGTNLERVKLDEISDLSEATFTGASVRFIDHTTLLQLKPFWQDIFADGTVIVPAGQRPAHWADEKLSDGEFQKRWRAWQRSIGQDPDNPE